MDVTHRTEGSSNIFKMHFLQLILPVIVKGNKRNTLYGDHLLPTEYTAKKINPSRIESIGNSIQQLLIWNLYTFVIKTSLPNFFEIRANTNVTTETYIGPCLAWFRALSCICDGALKFIQICVILYKCIMCYISMEQRIRAFYLIYFFWYVINQLRTANNELFLFMVYFASVTNS